MSENTILEFQDDIGNVEAPLPLPIGQYPCEIIGAELKDSKSGDSRYVSVQVRVHADAYPADFADGDPDGTVLMYNRLMYDNTKRNMHRIRRFCEAVGAKTGRSLDLTTWVGLTATIAIKHSEWEGEARAEIDRFIEN